MTVPDSVRLSRHVADLDDDGHDTRGGIPRVVYAECNSPNGSGGDNPMPWDTFYDETQSTISDAPLTAALAAIGLTLSGNVFTATTDGIYGLEMNFAPVSASVVQSNNVRIVTSGYLTEPMVTWGVGSTESNPPEDSAQVIGFMVFLQTGDTFRGRTIASGTVTAGVVAYAAMSIMKLV